VDSVSPHPEKLKKKKKVTSRKPLQSAYQRVMSVHFMGGCTVWMWAVLPTFQIHDASIVSIEVCRWVSFCVYILLLYDYVLKLYQGGVSGFRPIGTVDQEGCERNLLTPAHTPVTF
jgi:hypothetical protein